ncbi:hypothetical protein AnigIFM49718_003884 [Aspergillus niger]|nr:hypothetical protein AnigIFM49718_003884 [Aspergillus niger]
MDSILSIQVKDEPLSHTLYEASSPYLTTHQQGPTEGDLTDSVVRNNDNRNFISSLSSKSPFHLASSEDRSTQSAPLGSDQRHTDSPLFAKPEVFYEVTGSDRYVAQPILDAKLRKGFFEVNGKWTLYNRNYFSVECAVSFPREIENGLYIQRGGAELQQIHGFSVRLLASKDGENCKLVQHTPRRVRKREAASEEIIWFPLIANATGREAADRSEEVNIPRNVKLSNNNAGESRLFSHTFERIQFEKATPDYIKRRSQKQHFNLVIELNAQISGGEPDRNLHWLRIARQTSEPFIIRGQPAGHCKGGRRGDHTSIFYGGDGMRRGSLTASRPFLRDFEWRTDRRTNAEESNHHPPTAQRLRGRQRAGQKRLYSAGSGPQGKVYSNLASAARRARGGNTQA